MIVVGCKVTARLKSVKGKPKKSQGEVLEIRRTVKNGPRYARVKFNDGQILQWPVAKLSELPRKTVLRDNGWNLEQKGLNAFFHKEPYQLKKTALFRKGWVAGLAREDDPKRFNALVRQAIKACFLASNPSISEKQVEDVFYRAFGNIELSRWEDGYNYFCERYEYLTACTDQALRGWAYAFKITLTDRKFSRFVRIQSRLLSTWF